MPFYFDFKSVIDQIFKRSVVKRPGKFKWLSFQDADDSSPLPTSSDIVKVPDPQMCMVSGNKNQKVS